MAQYGTTISQSSFVYDETTQLYKTQIDTSTIEDFNRGFNITAIKVMRYISELQKFGEVLSYCEVDSSGILTIYAHERFNLKVLIVTDQV